MTEAMTLRHMDDDEEIRYIISGAGFWDIRGMLNVFKRTLVCFDR